MLIEREWLDNYNDRLNEISERGQQALREQLRNIDYGRSAEEVRNDVLAVMESTTATSTQSAAITSAGWYDGLRERSIGARMGAQAINAHTPEATAASVRAFLQRLFDGDYDAFEDLMCERLGYEVTNAAGRCVSGNAGRDIHQVRYARVPQGEKTCDFCLMIASRGPVYHTEESAGLYDKFHSHCDCRIVPFFNTFALYAEDGHYLGRRSEDALEGYNPDELYRQYLDTMLNPSNRARSDNGWKFPPSGTSRTYAAAWGRAAEAGLVTMRSIGEIQDRLRNVSSPSQLYELIQLINQELPYYGASAEVINLWRDEAIAAYNRLLEQRV